MDRITELDDLLARYGSASVGSKAKEQSVIGDHYRDLIEASPFCALATVGPDGLDCTPRGDDPGFIRVIDERTLELPDRKGNNRLDSLRNVIDDPRVSLLFLIPGRNETMRINGTAEIIVEPAVLASHAVGGRAPTTVLRITVDRAYFQCGKAPMRSGIWDPDRWPDISGLPTTGTISSSFRDGVDVAEYDATLDQRLRETMY
ncbi:MAG: pyridoxamine 5'-phosphate oxidase family protein [Actinomycetota bacterium]